MSATNRYRPQQTIGDNLRDLFNMQQQQISAGLGSSSIDWDDDGDDGESLDITVADTPGDDEGPYTTVAKYGHDGDRHGFLVPDGEGGWLLVQEDAQARADTAEADAKSYTDAQLAGLGLATILSRLAAIEDAIDTLQSQMTNRTNRIVWLEGQIADLWEAIN